ncbi:MULTISPECIES: PTS sugar transporter subunit IIB [Enterococcus]|uniref:PTS system mannose/fructose/N-acetylgalactosamine-transporter subunit IIB n=1 Tax=Enterococcus TaxID=1350 RepID=UPI00249F7C3A|nr:MULTISPECIES: PTS sugar transporter subunit IIB [Enterococcus]MDT2740024.1 PTS sugar transporter subunit IIB [Enterococcus canintestini]WHA09292.1 PTS sugar transporter subunit IIB [Enterococcus montenegrensis]
MSINLTRIDERLIHGQVAYSWSVAYPCDEIVVIDDQAANDEMQKMLLEMAVPEGKGFKLLTVAEGIAYFSNDNGLKSFLVIKDPAIIYELVKAGIYFDSINVGGMYFKEGKKEITKTVYVDERDVAVFKELAHAGVKLDVRTAPGDKSIELSSVI